MARKDYEDIDLLTFQAKFKNDIDCWDWLIKTRYPEGYKCPLCGSREYYFKKKRASVFLYSLFHRLLKACVSTETITRKELGIRN